MIVYRIEHKEYGWGPYKDGSLGKKLCDSHFNEDKHPCFAEDGITRNPDFSGRHVAGFDSEEKVVAWFEGYGKHLKRNGYKIAVYNVDDADVIFGKSGKQLAFKRSIYDPRPTQKPINFE
jgi:hypothetical protein